MESVACCQLRVSKTGDPIAYCALHGTAPDLLKALKGLFKHCVMVHKHWGENDNTQEADRAIKFAQAAISRAKGA